MNKKLIKTSDKQNAEQSDLIEGKLTIWRDNISSETRSGDRLQSEHLIRVSTRVIEKSNGTVLNKDHKNVTTDGCKIANVCCRHTQ